MTFLGRGTGRRFTTPEAECWEGLGRRGRAAPRGSFPALGRFPRGAAALRGSPPARWQRCRAPRTWPQLLPPMDSDPRSAPATGDAASFLHGLGLAVRPFPASAGREAPRPLAGRPGVVTQHLGTHRRLAAGREINRETLSAAPGVAAGRGDGVGIHLSGKKGGLNWRGNEGRLQFPSPEPKSRSFLLVLCSCLRAARGAGAE